MEIDGQNQSGRNQHDTGKEQCSQNPGNNNRNIITIYFLNWDGNGPTPMQ